MGLRVGIPPYPWGSCLERGTAAEDAGLPPINVYECVFVKSAPDGGGAPCVYPAEGTRNHRRQRRGEMQPMHFTGACPVLDFAATARVPRREFSRGLARETDRLLLPSTPRPLAFAHGFLASNSVEEDDLMDTTARTNDACTAGLRIGTLERRSLISHGVPIADTKFASESNHRRSPSPSNANESFHRKSQQQTKIAQSSRLIPDAFSGFRFVWRCDPG
ncbi:hypothetical protein K0M31_012272 [Melipona bicolor]|uniref:Uncharacterized protein n=1 Tax=Melipona bicolor TaxID=60889 RepID=A0AA40FK82_9HYME|nr:hypothetical protein K0M31_012272 [Melipona bicolor]